MRKIFADTAVLIALCNKSDNFHHQAFAVSQQLLQTNRKFITTNLILAEFANTFSKARYKSLAIDMLEVIHDSPFRDCIIADKRLMQKGIDLFKKMRDKDWSLVDCVSMVVADELRITEIFTTDHHFIQAGFTVLLKKNI